LRGENEGISALDGAEGSSFELRLAKKGKEKAGKNSKRQPEARLDFGYQLAFAFVESSIIMGKGIRGRRGNRRLVEPRLWVPSVRSTAVSRVSVIAPP
jgi:hypothetical protein